MGSNFWSSLLLFSLGVLHVPHLLTSAAASLATLFAHLAPALGIRLHRANQFAKVVGAAEMPNQIVTENSD